MLRDIEKRTPRHNDRPVEQPDDRYVRSRAEDFSFWIKTAYFIEKYRILFWLAGILLVAFGFGFQTPANKFDELKAEIGAVRHDLQPQIDSLKKNQDAQRQERVDERQMMEFSVRYICASLSQAEKYRLGGDDLCAAAAHTTTR